MIVKNVLEKDGFEVSEAIDGFEGLEKISNMSFGALIVDVNPFLITKNCLVIARQLIIYTIFFQLSEIIPLAAPVKSMMEYLS